MVSRAVCSMYTSGLREEAPAHGRKEHYYFCYVDAFVWYTVPGKSLETLSLLLFWKDTDVPVVYMQQTRSFNRVRIYFDQNVLILATTIFIFNKLSP